VATEALAVVLQRSSPGPDHVSASAINPTSSCPQPHGKFQLRGAHGSERKDVAHLRREILAQTTAGRCRGNETNSLPALRVGAALDVRYENDFAGDLEVERELEIVAEQRKGHRPGNSELPGFGACHQVVERCRVIFVPEDEFADVNLRLQSGDRVGDDTQTYALLIRQGMDAFGQRDGSFRRRADSRQVLDGCDQGR
jgi:hypothetical protein